MKPVDYGMRSDQAWVASLRGDHGIDAQYVAYEKLGAMLYGRILRLLQRWQYTVPGLSPFSHEDLEELAKDFVQVTLLKTHEERIYDAFRFDAQFSTYMTRIARNVMLTELRLKKWQSYHRGLPEDDPEGPQAVACYLPTLYQAEPAESSPIDAQSRRELWGCLEECVAALPERWRNAFLWRVVEQVGIEEAIHRLGAPSEQAVYGIVHRARLRLKQCLQGKGWSEDEIWRLVE